MPKTSWTNADLTPAAQRARLGLTDHTDVPTPDDYASGARGAALTTPDEHAQPGDRGFDWKTYNPSKHGIGEQNRLVGEAKTTQAATDPLLERLTLAGRNAENDANAESPSDAAVRSLGDTAVGVFKGARQIPGDLLGGMLGLPGTVLAGYASLPEGLKALVDPATWQGMPDAAKQSFLELANDPEQATRVFGGMLAAGPAADLAGTAVSKAPGAVGGAISKVGRGMQAVGQSPLVEGTGLLRKGAAILHPGLGTAVGAVGPELLSGAGRAVERFGGRVADIPNSPALAALRKLANTDIQEALTPEPTADELAASVVRETVNTAKGLTDTGQSRGQAAQRAGWPLAGDYELNEYGQPVNKYGTGDLGHHPGQDVRAHWPYEPNVRGNPTKFPSAPLEGLQKAATPEMTPFQRLSAEGAFRGDRSTGSFTPGPNSLQGLAREAQGIPKGELPSIGNDMSEFTDAAPDEIAVDEQARKSASQRMKDDAYQRGIRKFFGTDTPSGPTRRRGEDARKFFEENR